MDTPAPTPPPTEPPRPRRRRRLRVLLVGAGAALALGAAFVAWVLLTAFAEPPPLDGRPAVLDAALTVDDATGLRRLGPCWFLPREGASLLYLEGDPYTLGYANAALTADRLEAQERALVETVHTHFDNPLAFWGMAFLVLLNNRSLPEHVRPAELLEIRGLADGSPGDPYPEYGSRFHRILNYHAAHDISHWVWDKPVLGCTAFAAAGQATADGTLLVGRNFDWEAGEHFDRNKVIAVVRPDEGHGFLSVAWPGMAGAVTGLNDAGVWCSVNGAHSERMGTIGRPVSLVVRDVLQHAGDLDEAVRIVRESDVFVADAFLLAGGGRAVVVEKAPGLSAVRELDADGLLRLANHFETDAFADDAGNTEQRRVGTSESRQGRLDELLRQHAGGLDPARAVAILRDRAGPDGAPRSLGHRATINPMIATHAVVAEPEAGIAWVSRGPHQLGPFEAWRLADFDAAGPPEPAAAAIPADPALADGSLARLRDARAHLDEAVALLDQGEAAAALEFLASADELVPGHPRILMLRAGALAELGRDAEADHARRAALAAEPPFVEHRERLAAELGEG